MAKDAALIARLRAELLAFRAARILLRKEMDSLRRDRDRSTAKKKLSTH